ncbi:hypothetical protein [Niallia sp. FSL R7-0271]|uniref:hypothetical protein n=1 Tax=unclassified Niallia TaxID=2837522 RepID=UPI0030F5822C
MFIQLILITIMLFGAFLSIKGRLVQRSSVWHLGNMLGQKGLLEEEAYSITLEEENLFLRSLSGIRMKIIGALMMGITASLIILFHI